MSQNKGNFLLSMTLAYTLLALDIVENLEAGLESFRAIIASLKK
jgi:hypothetical protein